MAAAALNTYDCSKVSPFWYPELARKMTVKLGASLTLAKGTVLGELTASEGVFEDYNNAAADGTEVARAILPYDVTTDADGLITIGEHTQKLRSIEVWVAGYFHTTDLVGLNAAGVTDLGRIVYGALADGVLLIS